MIKRLFDIMLVITSLFVLWIPFLIIPLLIKIYSKGPIIYWSDRIGKDNKIFSMPKFRTMRIETPPIATHLLENPHQYLTPLGSFLRKTSLDEIPQLWCVLKGEMSLIGPRPALFNQYDLVELRTRHGVHKLLPGLSGLAQIKGRDALTIEEKIFYDKEYLQKKSFILDIKIIFLTLFVLFKISKKGKPQVSF